MAEELLDRILSEIRERLRDSHAAFEESRRLEAALAALDHRPAARARPGTSRRSADRRSGARPSARAPRGRTCAESVTK
jgi:hypothetical protein